MRVHRIDKALIRFRQPVVIEEFVKVAIAEFAVDQLAQAVFLGRKSIGKPFDSKPRLQIGFILRHDRLQCGEQRVLDIAGRSDRGLGMRHRQQTGPELRYSKEKGERDHID